jgi:hypothetical protein
MHGAVRDGATVASWGIWGKTIVDDVGVPMVLVAVFGAARRQMESGTLESAQQLSTCSILGL